MSESSPRQEYQRRQQLAVAELATANALSARISGYRLAAGAASAITFWLTIVQPVILVPWLFLPLSVLAALIFWHNQVDERRRLAIARSDLYQRGLDRIDGHWISKGEQGDSYRSEHHPYADDLDLFGEGSLFELLCTARTAAGQATLANWLQELAPIERIRQRHAALSELRDQVDLREQLALISATVQTGLHPRDLMRWASAPPVPFPAWATVAAPLLVLLNIAAIACVRFYQWPASFVLPTLLAQIGFALHLRPKVYAVLGSVDGPGRDLNLLAEVLDLLKKQQFESPYLRSLREALDYQGHPPSQLIRGLSKRIELLDSRRNAFFATIAPLLLWATQFAMVIERWRNHYGHLVPRWLEAVGELEALCALAGYHYEHPADPFPEFLDVGPHYEAQGLGHPLLPEAKVVRNDVCLDDQNRLLLVSGSNMSGKSTLLRSIGVNAVLAFAGAPVRAASLRISPLVIGASIRIQDSLQAGESRFYAEISRLRQVVELADRSEPLLFLLDEILSGTNSHDRRQGAAAIIRGLVQRGAIGLVTTHDLALAKIADELAPRAHNVHFADELENGRLRFDYHMRPGVVQRSNAIELMRSVGLDV